MSHARKGQKHHPHIFQSFYSGFRLHTIVRMNRMRCLRLQLRKTTLDNAACMPFIYTYMECVKRSTLKALKTTTRATHANEQNSSTNELLVAFSLSDRQTYTRMFSLHFPLSTVFLVIFMTDVAQYTYFVRTPCMENIATVRNFLQSSKNLRVKCPISQFSPSNVN